MNWHVIYTKSRSEKLVAEKLSQLGIEVYCPVLKLKKKWSDRYKLVEEPLFRSYCFVRIAPIDRERVFAVPAVVRYVFHCAKPAIIRDKEMDQLKSWLMDYEHESIEVRGLRINDQIVLRSGALMDKEALVLEQKGNYAILYLKDMGVQVKVDLRKNIVERLKAS